MIKTSPLRHTILSAVLGLFLFISFVTHYNHSVINDYNTFLNHSYFRHPFSMIYAGASTIETDNDDSSAQDTARRIEFSNVTNLTDNPNDSVYPQVAASENNVYVVWEDSTTPDLSNNNYDIYIKKSADWGESFAGNSNSSATDTTTEEVINLSNNPGFSEHPQIAAYNEKVHVAWIDNSLGNKEILFSRSIDNGTTFSEAINLSNTTNSNSRNLEIAAFENNVYAVWLDEDEQGNGIILLKASSDGGETFSNAVAIARNISSNNNDFTLPKVAAYGDNVYVAWNAVAYSSNAQGEGEIMTDLLYVKSLDKGNTFSTPIKLNNNGEKVGEAQLAAYNNAVYVVWGSSPYDHITSNLFFTKSTDNGNTFSNATEVENDNFVNPSNVEIVVVGNNNSEGNGGQSLSSSPSSEQVQEPQLYITGQVPLPDQNEEIFLASSSDNGDTFSQITTNLSNNSEFSECSSIAASANNIYVIWQDRTPGNNEALFTKAKI